MLATVVRSLKQPICSDPRRNWEIRPSKCSVHSQKPYEILKPVEIAESGAGTSFIFMASNLTDYNLRIIKISLINSISDFILHVMLRIVTQKNRNVMLRVINSL